MKYPKPALIPSEQAKLSSIQFKGVIFCPIPVKIIICLNIRLKQTIKLDYLLITEKDKDDDNIQGQSHDANDEKITSG